ncbi:LOW QUALITY PROTEIN: uncharacterized protein LOC112552638 [Pogonomyrmex barbatus]|uniref:LOW QUALITY PROTEIN: uncharacterized protein LOC112552638 n=1 Tax=Pogonomyrmex barbatus TaxID=144034 RepID=A0A8N1S5H7_9HYME|nr:LOW QUALITY PROTEIN: uncharacterized protein LOC112552638 [Pogonomyrmex barbatus]
MSPGKLNVLRSRSSRHSRQGLAISPLSVFTSRPGDGGGKAHERVDDPPVEEPLAEGCQKYRAASTVVGIPGLALPCLRPLPCRSSPPSTSPSSYPLPEDATEGAVHSRWWKVWGLTHGLTTANPWMLVAAAAPCRAFHSETTTATAAADAAAAATAAAAAAAAAAAVAAAATTATVREGAAVTRWAGRTPGQTFQAHPDGETPPRRPAIGSPSVLTRL